MKTFHPPILFRMMKIALILNATFIAVILIYGFFKDVAFAALCLGPILLLSIAVTWLVGSLLPSISIAESHIKIHTIWGFSKVLSWKEIKEVRPPKMTFFPSPFRKRNKSIVLKTSKNIGVIYSIYGFMYDVGGQTIIIDVGKGREEFLSLLLLYCPHAFHHQSTNRQ